MIFFFLHYHTIYDIISFKSKESNPIISFNPPQSQQSIGMSLSVWKANEDLSLELFFKVHDGLLPKEFAKWDISIKGHCQRRYL